MTALRVLPPQDYVGVVESIPKIAAAVAQLVDQGLAYYVPVPGRRTAGPTSISTLPPSRGSAR